MPETQIIEFRETVTNSFLKTVSAFADYHGGTISMSHFIRKTVLEKGIYEVDLEPLRE